MAAFVGVFAAWVGILAAGCIIAQRAIGTHSVVKNEPPFKPPRA